MPSYSAGSLNSRRASWYDDDGIERRVMEMAGVPSSGRASPPRSRSRRPGTAPGAAPTLGAQAFGSSRSARSGSGGSGGASKLAVVEPGRSRPSHSPSPGSLQPAEPQLDMAHLKHIASSGPNARCADCGRPTKTSRWATLSEFILQSRTLSPVPDEHLRDCSAIHSEWCLK